jgi:hypothetical protein
MSGLRHDARECRQRAASELIRHTFGYLTPEEQKAQEEVERERKQAQAKKATLGPSLFEDEDLGGGR